MNYIGIDIGTSSIKALLYKDNQIYSFNKDNTSYNQQNNWSEQDPNEWWENFKAIIKEISIQCSDIEYICLTGQMHSLVTLDKNDKTIRNAILWNDQRTSNETNYITNTITEKVLIDETSNIMLNGFTAPKLLWLRNNEVENYSKIDKIFLPKDFIAYKLTKIHCTDVSDASGTGVFNVKERTWSTKLIDQLEFKKSWFGRVFESNQIIGEVNELEITKLIGKPKLIIGGGDQAMSAIGTGVTSSREISISLGTSGVVFYPSQDITNENKTIHCFCDANNGYHKMGVMLSFGSSISWWQKNIIETDNYNNLKFDKVNNDNTVYFFPYLSGERCPFSSNTASGTFVGITANTNKENMSEAVLQGVAFSIKNIYDEMNIKDNVNVVLTGGGKANEYIVNVLRSLIKNKFKIINQECGPSLGCLIMCLSTDANIDIQVAATQLITDYEVIQSDCEIFNIEEKYLQWLTLQRKMFLTN